MKIGQNCLAAFSFAQREVANPLGRQRQLCGVLKLPNITVRESIRFRRIRASSPRLIMLKLIKEPIFS